MKSVSVNKFRLFIFVIIIFGFTAGAWAADPEKKAAKEAEKYFDMPSWNDEGLRVGKMEIVIPVRKVRKQESH